MLLHLSTRTTLCGLATVTHCMRYAVGWLIAKLCHSVNRRWWAIYLRPSSNTEELPVHVFILWCSFPLFCLVDVCHCIQFIAWAKHIKQLMFVLLQDIVVPKNTNTFRWDLKNWCRLCFCPPDGTLLSGCTGDCPSAYKNQLEVHFSKSRHPRRRGRFIRRW